MQTLFKTPILLLLAGMLWRAQAAEQTAVVNEGKINVRGQPALVGEVVTQLQRGDEVTVLEYVRNERAKGGEPTNWAKIKLPVNTPVWVYSEMIKSGAVSATRLNLRAGPGENYSVIGRLGKGDAVKTIRTMGDWTEVEAPPGAYAFVDATLLKPGAGTAAAAGSVAAAPQPETPAGRNGTVLETHTERTPTRPVETKPVASATVPPVATVANPNHDAFAPPTIPAPQPQIEPPATQAAAIPSIVSAKPALQNNVTAPAPTKAQPSARSEVTSEKRIVRREGIIKSTLSIQAPTWYELVHPETKKTIDYLHEEKLGVKLKQFKGQKVIVSGEEAIDPRWPNTPILEIETLDAAP